MAKMPNDNESAQRPFSKEYVLRTTNKQMRKAVEVSIQKTLARVAEFEGNSAMSMEILTTLSTLDAMKKVLDESMKNLDTLSKQ